MAGIKDLTQMRADESGIIVDLQGGQFFIKKARSMGIRPMKRIKKVSSHFWRGPQTIEIDNARFAIGYGMAKKILVQMDR